MTTSAPSPLPAPHSLLDSLSQRRGKIARLPRAVRDQLNIHIDDGHEADEILRWLNPLPEVRKIIDELFNGSPVSPQNLSAWRQGGFQDWLLHRELLYSAVHMREHAEDLQNVLASDAPDGSSPTLADLMVTQLTVRFAAFMGRWDGGQADGQAKTLLKIGQFILKLQQASYQYQREALELTKLKREAMIENDSHLHMMDAYEEYCAEGVQQEETEKPRPEAKTKTHARKKARVQSSSIKAAKGSRPNEGSSTQSAEPAILENVEFGHDTPHPSPMSSPSAGPNSSLANRLPAA